MGLRLGWLMEKGPQRWSKAGHLVRRRRPPYTAEDIRFTVKGNLLHGVCLGWPGDEVTIKSLGMLYESGITLVKMLGVDEELEWSLAKDGLKIETPDEKPCGHAYVFRIVRTGI